MERLHWKMVGGTLRYYFGAQLNDNDPSAEKYGPVPVTF